MENNFESLHDNKLGIMDLGMLKQAEKDIVTTKIKMVFNKMPYIPSVLYLIDLHKFLFEDIYGFAGKIRINVIYKEEDVLLRDSVKYSMPEDILSDLEKVFNKIKTSDLESASREEFIDFTVNMLVDIWKIHPFREGNTRTSLVFLRTFLHHYGYDFDIDFFKHKGTFDYMRTSLVVASYEAEDLGVKRNYNYANKIIGDIISKSNYQKRK